MKHGIYYAYWEKDWNFNYRSSIEKASKLGFDVLELCAIPIAEYSDLEIKELSEISKNCGIELTAGYGPPSDMYVGSDNNSTRQKALDWSKRCFENMKKLDMKIICGGLHWCWPMNKELVKDKNIDINTAIEGTRLLAQLAAQYDITINIEILNRYENHILNTAEEGVSFVSQIGLPNVKLLLDTFHMNIEERDISDAILMAGSHLGHFHTAECDRDLPGSGKLKWDEIADAMKKINYCGAIVMEPFIISNCDVGDALNIWRNIGDVDDAFLDSRAKSALDFQRKIFRGLI